MKNHTKARLLYKDITSTGSYDLIALEREIYSEASGANSVKELIENICTDFGKQESQDGIVVLEYMYEKVLSPKSQLYDYAKLRQELTETNKEELFDVAFNIMYTTARSNNNKILLTHLDTYKDYYVDHNHSKELYSNNDSSKMFLDTVTKYITDALGNYTLKGLMIHLATTFTDKAEDVVLLLEAIYDALGKNQSLIDEHQELCVDVKDAPINDINILDKDALFYEALSSMHRIALDNNNDELLGQLRECYPSIEL